MATELSSMSQAKSPESKVRGSVRDGPQAVLNGVDGLLVDKRLSKLKLPEKSEKSMSGQKMT